VSRKSRKKAGGKKPRNPKPPAERQPVIPEAPDRGEGPALQMTGDEIDRERRVGRIVGALGLLFAIFGVFGPLIFGAAAGPLTPRPDKGQPLAPGTERTLIGIDQKGGTLVRVGGFNGRPSPDQGLVEDYTPLGRELGPVVGLDAAAFDSRTARVLTSGPDGPQIQAVDLATGNVGAPHDIDVESDVHGLALAVKPPGATDETAELEDNGVAAIASGDDQLNFVKVADGSVLPDSPVAITGLGPGEAVRAIEAAPDGDVIALAVSGGGSRAAATVYAVDPGTGEARRLGSATGPATDDLDQEDAYGFDVSANATAARVVTPSGKNISIDLARGSGTTQSALGPGAPDVAEIVSVREPGVSQLPDQFRAFGSGEFLLGSIAKLIGYMAVIPLGLFLWAAIRRRRPVSGVLRALCVIAPLLLPLAGLIGYFALADVVHQFLAAPHQTWPVALQIRDGSSLLRINYVLEEVVSRVLFGIWLAWLAYETMQTGLSDRFLGTLGVGAGVLALFPEIGAALALAWLGSMSVLTLGYWPGGRPRAWDAGAAVSPDAPPIRR
jgi:hypothetical protein